MKNWLKASWCYLRGHKISANGVCPVTGAVLLVCSKCGKDNMPKHSKGMSFN
jgi:ribosome-binding protein aMBF1 (putative translation factor)